MKKTKSKTKAGFINTIINRMNSVERMRRDFVANVSHELRTPLTVIQGYMEVLIERSNGGQYNDIYQEIAAQSTRMENLVSNLLLLSKLESTVLHVRHIVNVSSMIEAICSDVKTVFSSFSHQYNVYLDPNLMLQGEERLLKSIFNNLLSNACKYTPNNGLIQVAWFQSGDTAIFEVRDTGIGIENTHIPRLTERFYRVDKARSRNSGGTGLGLAIVKHALMRHEGVLEITSQPDKGSCFRAIFPLSKELHGLEKTV